MEKTVCGGEVVAVFMRCRKIAKSEYYPRHVCLSVRMEQLVSHRTDFNES